MAREIRKENQTARRTETKMKKEEGERRKFRVNTRERKRIYPLHSNNCHLLSPFICTNRSAITLLSLAGQVFQRRLRLKGSMDDLDKTRRMHVLRSHELERKEHKKTVLVFLINSITICFVVTALRNKISLHNEDISSILCVFILGSVWCHITLLIQSRFRFQTISIE